MNAHGAPPQPAILLQANDVAVLVELCRTLSDLAAAPPRSRTELVGELLDAWCRLRVLLMWRLPAEHFAVLNL